MSSYSADRVDVEDAEEGLEGEDEAGDGDLEGGGDGDLEGAGEGLGDLSLLGVADCDLSLFSNFEGGGEGVADGDLSLFSVSFIAEDTISSCEVTSTTK